MVPVPAGQNELVLSETTSMNLEYRSPKAIIDLTKSYMPQGASFCQHKPKEITEAENQASECVQKHYKNGTFCSIFKEYNADCYKEVIKNYESCLEAEYHDVLKLEVMGQKLATEYACNLSTEKFLEILRPCSRNGLDKGLKKSMNTINKYYSTINTEDKNYAKIFCSYADNVYKSVKDEVRSMCGNGTQDVILGIVKNMIVEPCKRITYN